MADHIHKVGDGRGFRRVFVDGQEIKYAIYADTKRGIVDAYRIPLKINRWGKRLLADRFRGAVEVEFIDG